MPKEAAVTTTDLAKAADQLFKVREKRYTIQRSITALEEEEAQLREFLINNLPKSKAEGITGRVARATIVRKTIAQVKDWPKFYAFILKTKDFSLMQKRCNDGAIQERWENNKVVPGTDKFVAVNVSVTKK